MVRIFLFFAVALVLQPCNLFAVTADELREMSADINREQQASGARAKTSDTGSLLKSDVQSTQKTNTRDRAVKKNKFNKRTGGDGSSQHTYHKKETRSGDVPTAAVPAQPDIPSGSKIIVSDAVTVESKPFGIRIGTWMTGSINRDTSSAEPGLVEITLSADVAGDKRILPSGTILFCRKELNGATKRLQMLTEKGITPHGEEFKMAGSIFDSVKVSGLAGIISGNDTEKTVSRGVNKGVLAAAGAVARMAGSVTPIGSAAGAAADSVIQDRTNVVEESTQQTITVYVSPQSVLIRVDHTF